MSIQKNIDKEIQAVSDIAFEYMSNAGMDWSKVETLCSLREGGTESFLAVVHGADGEVRRIDQNIGEITMPFIRINDLKRANPNQVKWNGLRIFTTKDKMTQTEFITDPDFEEDVIDQLWEEVDI